MIDPTQGTPAWDVIQGPPVRFNSNVPTSGVFHDTTAYLNFIRSPNQPFYNNDATLYVNAYTAFWNTGQGATFTPMDVPVTGLFIPPAPIRRSPAPATRSRSRRSTRRPGCRG